MVGIPARGDFVVVDYGVNNVGSVVNMMRRLEINPVVARDAQGMRSAAAIVLPGIGAFDTGVENLRASGLFDAIRERVTDGVPILGICLGMQLLTRGSEEGSREGLGLLPATTRRFAFPSGPQRLKVPHMGWNETACLDPELFAGFEGMPARFYYVHSYHVVCEDDLVAARCSYGIDVTAAVRRGHVFGTQFHPEKSHRFGMRVFANFVQAALHA